METNSLSIYGLLYRLGVTRNYKGFFQTAYAVELCRRQPDRLILVTKLVYPEVAKRSETSWMAVERNIRTVSDVIWRKNRPLLNEIAHVALAERPCPAQLLSILAVSVDADTMIAYETDEAADCGRNVGRMMRPVEFDHVGTEANVNKLN